ncbi:MAG: hypothetical protein V1934_03755 [Methanobacteriota archaeon]
MEVGLNEFLTIFMLTFAVFLLVAGIFTAYFGSGKSRKIGGGLLGLGLVLGLIWVIISSWLILDEPIITVSLKEVIIQSVLVIVAAAVGALAAIGMFLAAIMKA